MSNVGVTKLIVLVGSGFAGSVLITKNKFGEFLGDLSKVKRLTQEIRSLPRMGLTVVQGGGSGSSGVSITTFFLPAAVLGALSYGWMKWRGYSFADVMYVTRKGMNDAVASMGKQLENVSAALSSTRKHMNQRMDTVNAKLDDSIVITGLIKDQVEDVKGTVGRSSREIENVNMKLEGLGLKIEEVRDSQNFANQGISLLIEWVHRLNVVGSNQLHAELAPGFKSWYQKAITLDRTSKLGGAFTSPGLKQLFSDALEPPPVNNFLEITPVMNTEESRPPSLNSPSPGVSIARTLSTSVLSRSDLQRGLSGSGVFWYNFSQHGFSDSFLLRTVKCHILD